MKIKLSRNFVLYAVIGLSGVTIDVVVFIILNSFFHVDKMVATFISITLAITNNFLLNTYTNFKTKDRLLGRYARFYLVGLSGVLLTDGILYLFVDVLGFNTTLVKIGSLFPVLLLQYSLNKQWAFKQEVTTNAETEEV